jgi:hypothetical protein
MRAQVPIENAVDVAAHMGLGEKPLVNIFYEVGFFCGER